MRLLPALLLPLLVSPFQTWESRTLLEGVGAADSANPGNPLFFAPNNVLYIGLSTRIHAYSNGSLVPVAGSSAAGYRDGVGSAALLTQPGGFSASSVSGRLLLYFADAFYVRTLDPASAAVAVLAGRGVASSNPPVNAVGTAAAVSPTATAVIGSTLYMVEVSFHRIRTIDLLTLQVSTFAGGSLVGQGGCTDGPVATALFNNPMHIAVGTDGALLVIDKYNIRIRRVANGQVSTLAGFGLGAPAVVDGVGTSGSFYPHLAGSLKGMGGLAVDASNNLYVADACRIRLVSPAGAMRTLAGGASCGSLDGASAVHSELTSNTSLITLSPAGIALTPEGLLLLDGGRLRLFAPPPVSAAPSISIQTLVGGSGPGFPDPGFLDGAFADAKISQPYAVALSGSGRVYFGDQGNNAIRSMFAGVVTTLAGGGSCRSSGALGSVDGVGTAAVFNAPRNLVLLDEGLLVVAETFGHRLRAVPTNGSATYTLAGSARGTPGFSDGPGTAALMNQPWGLGMIAGIVYFSDWNNHRVRAFAPGNGSVWTVLGNGTSANIPGVGTAASLRQPGPMAVPSGALAPPGVSFYIIASGIFGGAPFRGGLLASFSLATGQLAFFAGNEGVKVCPPLPFYPYHCDGVGTSAWWNNARGLTWCASDGALYMSEFGSYLVSRVTPSGVVTGVVGGLMGFADGVGTTAQIFNPTGLDCDSSGDLVVADTANNALRVIAARDCRLGSYCPSPTQRLPCPAGTVGLAVAATAALACSTCPPGFWCPPGSALLTIVPCPVGSFCPGGASAPTPCAPGTFAAVEQSFFCPSCPAGSLAPAPGSGTCAKYCPPGSFRGSPGGVNASASCVPCAAGTYVPYDGATACLPCASGTWSAALGAVSAATCAPCPALYTSPPASTSAAACVPAVFACPPGTQPALGLLAGGEAPTSAQQCSPLACPPPLLLNALGTACLGCAPGTAGAFPACQALPCSGGGICVGGDAAPLLPFALDDSIGQQLPSEGGGGGGGAAVSLPVIGVAAGAVFLALSLAALALFVRRLGLLEKLDSFALKPPAAVGGHPTMNPTAAGALCSILGMATILALAAIQLAGFFSMENSTRGESSGIVTPAALKGVGGLRWRGDGGLTLSLAVAARSSSDAPGGGGGSASSASSASACAAPLSWSASPLVQGRWVLLPAGAQAPSRAAPARLARNPAPVTFQLDCLDCLFTPASSLQLFLHHSCQALHVYAYAPAGDGSPSFQTMDPAATCGNSSEGALAAVAWALSPQLHVLNDTLPPFVSAGASARGYLLMSQETTAARAPRAAASGAAGAAQLLPLASAVRLTVRLPLNANMQTSTLVQRQTWVQLLTGISGLAGLLGAFGVGAALLAKLLPAPGAGRQQGGAAPPGAAGGATDAARLTENPMAARARRALAPSAPGSAREVRLAARYLLERDDCLPPGWTSQEAAAPPRSGGGGGGDGGAAPAHVFCGPSGEQTLADPRDDTEAYVQQCLAAWRGGVDVAAGAPADLGARAGEGAARLLRAGALPPRWAVVRGELVAPCGARGLPDPRGSQGAMEEEVAAVLGAQARGGGGGGAWRGGSEREARF